MSDNMHEDNIWHYISILLFCYLTPYECSNIW
jgi:hypothetical protein